MEEEPKNFFQELKQLVTEYLAARMKLLKYEVYEKSAKIAATLFSSLVTFLLTCMVLFFLSISVGFYVGSLLNSYGAGFLIVTGFYFVLLLPFLLARKSLIEKRIIDRIIEKLMEKEEEEQ
jgi:hypothetical protein